MPEAGAVLGLGMLLRLPPLARLCPPGAFMRRCFNLRVAVARRSCHTAKVLSAAARCMCKQPATLRDNDCMKLGSWQ